MSSTTNQYSSTDLANGDFSLINYVSIILFCSSLLEFVGGLSHRNRSNKLRNLDQFSPGSPGATNPHPYQTLWLFLIMILESITIVLLFYTFSDQNYAIIDLIRASGTLKNRYGLYTYSIESLNTGSSSTYNYPICQSGDYDSSPQYIRCILVSAGAYSSAGFIILIAFFSLCTLYHTVIHLFFPSETVVPVEGADPEIGAGGDPIHSSTPVYNRKVSYKLNILAETSSISSSISIIQYYFVFYSTLVDQTKRQANSDNFIGNTNTFSYSNQLGNSFYLLVAAGVCSMVASYLARKLQQFYSASDHIDPESGPEGQRVDPNEYETPVDHGDQVGYQREGEVAGPQAAQQAARPRSREIPQPRMQPPPPAQQQHQLQKNVTPPLGNRVAPAPQPAAPQPGRSAPGLAPVAVAPRPPPNQAPPGAAAPAQPAGYRQQNPPAIQISHSNFNPAAPGPPQAFAAARVPVLISNPQAASSSGSGAASFLPAHLALVQSQSAKLPSRSPQQAQPQPQAQLQSQAPAEHRGSLDSFKKRTGSISAPPQPNSASIPGVGSISKARRDSSHVMRVRKHVVREED